MTKTKKKISLALSLSVLLALLLQCLLPIVSYAGDDTIYIGSAEELLDFAKKCSYDAWSIGKNVVLTDDISLEGVKFEPVPSFSGSFDGNGHKISGLEISGAYSPAGLFSTLEGDGVVKNLTLSAVISPDGEKGCVGGIVGKNSGRIENCNFIGTVIGACDVGGIAGINRTSGSISDCTVGGEIIGETRTGGIAGTNDGLISSCNNGAKVNTISLTPSLSLDELNLSLTLDISRLPSLNSSTTMTDTGGIAGYCTGMIIGCTNSGRVGYPHVGYNVGGIAGRSNGHLSGNINGADVYGRKDVGGIVGQMEPNISYNLSEDLLLSLKTELDGMSAVVSGAVTSVGGGIPGISARLDTILENIDGATDSLNILINSGTEYGDELVGEVNRVSEVLDEVISQLSGITEDIPTLSGLLGEGLSSLESALGGLENIATIGGEAIPHLKNATDDASAAFESIGESLGFIESGLDGLQNAITVEDKDAAKASLETIADGLSALVDSMDGFTKAMQTVNDVLADAAWVDKGLEELSALMEIFSKVSESVSTIYDATVEIKENLDINWSSFTEAGAEISDAIGHLAEAASALAEAIDSMDKGITKIGDGLEAIGSAVSVNDPEALEAAIDEIRLGFDDLMAASQKASEALASLSEIMGELEQGGNLTEIFGDASAAIGDIADAGAQISGALTRLQGGISALLGSLDIDSDKLNEGGALVIEGLDELSVSLGKMRDVTSSIADAMISLDRAIKAAEEAVIIKDEDKLSTALDSAYGALGEIISSVNELATLLTEVSETLKEAKLWSDKLVDSMGDVTDAISLMSDALVKVQEGVDSLRANLSFDIDAASEGFGSILDGLVKMADAAVYIKNCFAHMSDAITELDIAAEYAPAAISDLKESMARLADAASLITSMSEKIHRLVGYLDGIDPIQLPSPSESISEAANRLFIYISAIENELKYLNSDITSLSSDLVERVGRLNEIFDKLSENIVDTIYGLDDELVDDDITEGEIDSVTAGKLFGCQNSGNVYGDKNVGGISGAMGIEYALDPEDDMSGELSLTQKKTYMLRAVIHACQSYGSVTSKYDGVGGIVGKMDLGLIYGAEAYGAIGSEGGNYVGGIAGITAGLISQSFAKCTLSGGKYIGGIVGSGVTEDYSGDSSIVRNCYSMVEITKFTQYAGAISGVNAGEFTENLFVSDTLAGIDRVSYIGKAEPISYEDLVKRRSIPDGFYSLTLEFVADGKVIHSVEFEYGASFDQSVFPEIPVKEGHYGRWDRTDLSSLMFDTKVSVVYKPYTTAIDSDEIREDGREIFFVTGEFTEDDKITVDRGCDTATLPLGENAFTKDSLSESWTLTIPKDNLDINNLHFLPEKSNCKIYVKFDGVWQQVEAREFGSYLTFTVSGEVIELAVIEQSLNISIELIICLALILIQTVVIVCIVVKKKKEKKKK